MESGVRSQTRQFEIVLVAVLSIELPFWGQEEVCEEGIPGGFVIFDN